MFKLIFINLISCSYLLVPRIAISKRLLIQRQFFLLFVAHVVVFSYLQDRIKIINKLNRNKRLEIIIKCHKPVVMVAELDIRDFLNKILCT